MARAPLLRFVRIAWFVALPAVVLGTAAPAAEPVVDWNPQRTFVFAVGILEWERGDLWSPFPEAVPNRRDEKLVAHFRSHGVPDDQIVYLQDAQATKKRIQRRFVELLNETDEGDWLVFYFAGHGYRHAQTNRTWFANYDAADKNNSGWSVAAIFDAIDEHFSGDRVLLVADCCHSGALYDEVLARRDDDLGLAALTSSYSHNSSTGAWTFSDRLLKALHGRPSVDFDHDGDVDLTETARYVEAEMAFIEEQKSMFTANARFRRDLRLAAAQGRAKPKAGYHCEVSWKGKWYKAEVLEYDEASARYHIHYVGFDARWDEWVGDDRIRAYEPPSFAVGTRIEAYDGDAWYPAVVRQNWYGLHMVHYDDYDSTWDQWLGPTEVRRRGSSR